jgi:hypothetical protein
MKIGTITKEQLLKSDRRARREADLIDSNGWTGTHKVHKSKKNYTRKNKHKNKFGY